MNWSKKLGAGLAATCAAAVTSWAAARDSIPKPPEPGFFEVCGWIASGNDPVATMAALIGGLTTGYSLWQMFQPAIPFRACN